MPLTLMTRSPASAPAPRRVATARGQASGSRFRLRPAGRQFLQHLPRARTCRSPARRADPRSCCSRTRRPRVPGRSWSTLPSCTPNRRASFSSYFWPISMALARSVALMTCLILLRAREVLTSASQSRLGMWPGWVRISTMSPLRRRVLQRDDAAVDLGADAGVADVAVNRVSEIDRRRFARQHDHLAARREGVDLLRVQVHLQGGHELARVAHLALPLDQLPQPGDALVVVGRTALALLVLPVRRDALFGDAVHLLGPDLHFEGCRSARSPTCAATGRGSAAEWR